MFGILPPPPPPPHDTSPPPYRRSSPRKKGRGKRPTIPDRAGAAGSVTAAGDHTQVPPVRSESDAAVQGTNVGGGWVLYFDANGHVYFWNEALQESRCEASAAPEGDILLLAGRGGERGGVIDVRFVVN